MQSSYTRTLTAVSVAPFAGKLYRLWDSLPSPVRFESRRHCEESKSLLDVDLPLGPSRVEVRNRRSEDLLRLAQVLQFLFGMTFGNKVPRMTETTPIKTLIESACHNSGWHAAWNTQCQWLQPSAAITFLSTRLDLHVRRHTIKGNQLDPKTFSRLGKLRDTFPKLEELAAGLRILEATAVEQK